MNTLRNPYGRYRISMKSGAYTAGLPAARELLQWRNSHNSMACVIERVTIGAAVTNGVYFAAADVPFGLAMAKCTAWTASAVGGTNIVLGAGCKKRADYDDSRLVGANDLNISTTGANGGGAGAGLAAGTKTVQTNVHAETVGHGPIAAPGVIIPQGTVMSDGLSVGNEPLYLGPNEGFIIYVGSMPATGTWRWGAWIDWAEYPGPGLP